MSLDLRPSQVAMLRTIEVMGRGASDVTVARLSDTLSSPASSVEKRVRRLKNSGAVLVKRGVVALLPAGRAELERYELERQGADRLLCLPELQVRRGDLWDFYARGWKIVVTTNIGWAEHAANVNNMGAGVALQAMLKFHELPEWYGKLCARHRADMPVVERRRLVFFPVKPLLERDPAFSWNQRASLELIASRLPQLAQIRGKVALGFPGCGNGQLDPKDVLPLLRAHLDPARFVVIDRNAEAPLALPTAFG